MFGPGHPVQEFAVSDGLIEKAHAQEDVATDEQWFRDEIRKRVQRGQAYALRKPSSGFGGCENCETSPKTMSRPGFSSRQVACRASFPGSQMSSASIKARSGPLASTIPAFLAAAGPPLSRRRTVTAAPKDSGGLRRAVRGAVIDDEDLPGRESLAQNAPDALPEIANTVVDGNDDGYLNHRTLPLNKTS